MDKIKSHFEEEAREFDETIVKVIPYYNQMIEAAASSLPFERSNPFEVIDMGCGTGSLARSVKDKYPNVKITCMDISENMLEMARLKLADSPDTIYMNSDFHGFDFARQYDAVVSSLALHHLETPDEKLDFYRKIYRGLKAGGVFTSADVVLASTDALQKEYMEKWTDYICRSIPRGEVESSWIPKYYEEDRPASMMEHIGMLKQTGFTSVDIVWKYYNFAVYMAVK